MKNGQWSDMSKVKVILNRSGVRALMQSPEMQKICTDYANAALSKLGSGYEVTSMVGKTRCNAEIAAVSRAARKENAKNNTIMKAVGG